MTYQINIDQLFKVWQSHCVSVEFDGTEEELRQYIKDQNGNISNLFPDYIESETLTETEEYMNEYDLVDIEEF